MEFERFQDLLKVAALCVESDAGWSYGVEGEGGWVSRGVEDEDLVQNKSICPLLFARGVEDEDLIRYFGFHGG